MTHPAPLPQELVRQALFVGADGDEASRSLGDGFHWLTCDADEQAWRLADESTLAAAVIDGRADAAGVALADRLRGAHPYLPIVWLGAPKDGLPADACIAERGDPCALRAAIDRLLCVSHYPAHLVEGFARSARSALLEGFRVRHETGAVMLKANRRALGQVSGIVPLVGEEVAGELLVCASTAALRAARRGFLGPGAAAGFGESADLAGELANQILGRFKVEASHHGMRFGLGLPVFVIGRDVTVHYGAGRPAIALTLTTPDGSVYVELCVTRSIPAHDHAVAQEAGDDAVAGEISFL